MSFRVDSWDIVFWQEGNSCDFVPSIWAVNTEKTLYLFPVNVTRKTLISLIHTCQDPSTTTNVKYREHRAIYKKTVSSLEVAEQLIQKAVDTDNFDSESRSGSEDAEYRLLANNDNGNTGIMHI